MLLHLLISVLATIIIEISVSNIIGITNIKDIKKIIIINFITNLSINIIVYILNNSVNFNILYFIIVPIFEIIVFLVEGYYFKKLEYKKKNSYIVSLILNSCSYGCGLLYTLLQIIKI